MDEPHEWSVAVEGLSGELLSGYQVAAELGRWRLALEVRSPRRYRLVADVVAVSDHWMARGPLALRLDVGRESWRWGRAVPRWLDGERVAVPLAGRPDVTRGA